MVSRLDKVIDVKDVVNDGLNYGLNALDICSQCGLCLNACTVYRATRDPRLSPIYRLRAAIRVLKQGTYNVDDVVSLYTCNLCGACTAICPFGIEILKVVYAARIVLKQRGVIPEELRALAEVARRSGHSFTTEVGKLRAVLEKACRETGVEIESSSEYLYAPNPFETTFYPRELVHTLRLLRKLGLSVTVSRHVLDLGGNPGIDGNDPLVGFNLYLKAVEEAERLGAKKLIIGQCGADTKLYVLAKVFMPELARKTVIIYQLLTGKVKFKVDRATLFTSCGFARHWLEGVKILRELLEAKLPRDKAPYTMCCGGGGGMNFLNKSKPYTDIRRTVYKWRFENLISFSKAEALIVPCIKCYTVFRYAMLLAKKPRYRVQTLVSLLDERLGSASQP